MTSLHEFVAPKKRTRRITVLISGSGSNLQALLDASQTPILPNAQVTFVLSSLSSAYGIQRARNHIPPVPTSICARKTFLNRNQGSTREDYDAEIARQVLDSRPDLVIFAGWMHIFSERFLEVMEGSVEPPPAPALPPPGPSSIPTQTEPIPSHQTHSSNEPAANHNHESGASAAGPSKTLPEPPNAQNFPIPCLNLHPALPGQFDGANAIERTFEAFQQGKIDRTGVMVHRVIRDVDRGEPVVIRWIKLVEGETLDTLHDKIHSTEHVVIVEAARIVLEQLDRAGVP